MMMMVLHSQSCAKFVSCACFGAVSCSPSAWFGGMFLLTVDISEPYLPPFCDACALHLHLVGAEVGGPLA